MIRCASAFNGPHYNNYEVFRECLSSAIVARSEYKPSKTSRRKQKAKNNGRKDVTTVVSSLGAERADPEELAEFIDFIASEIFTAFPTPLRTLSYAAIQHDPSLAARYVPTDTDTPIPPSTLESLCATLPVSVADTLTVYGILPDASDVPELLSPVLTEFVASTTTGPPVWATTRTNACEICERDWIPLSYHHLIPRGVHAKVLKKGWHDEWMLNSVAWLCRACHSFVHRMASNEELAREWFTIDRILEREDVRNWAMWVGRVRWKAK